MSVIKLLIKGTCSIYIAALDLGIKLSNRKDRLVIKANEAEIKHIDAVQKRAENILASVQKMEDEAEKRIIKAQREILSDLNEYQNARDAHEDFFQY